MKKYILISITILLLPILLYACNNNDDITNGTNLTTTTSNENNTLDKYINDNFTKPYNIEVLYSYKESLLESERYFYPPDIKKIQPILEVLQKVWIEPYSKDNLGGKSFIKENAPRQIVFVGSSNKHPTSTVAIRKLAGAEAGKRITFFETNLIDFNNPNDPNVLTFLAILHHEYIHILNQNKGFEIEKFGVVTKGLYVPDWFNTSNEEARELGFISSYARLNEREDFAETCAYMLIRSKEEWDTLLDSINDKDKVALIKTKVQIIVEYFEEKYNVDFYSLRDEISKAIKSINSQNNNNTP